MKLRWGMVLQLTGKTGHSPSKLYGFTFGRWFVGIMKLQDHPFFKNNQENRNGRAG